MPSSLPNSRSSKPATSRSSLRQPALLRRPPVLRLSDPTCEDRERRGRGRTSAASITSNRAPRPRRRRPDHRFGQTRCQRVRSSPLGSCDGDARPARTDAIIVNVNYPLGLRRLSPADPGRDGDRAVARHLYPRQGRHAQRPDRRCHARQCRLRRALRQHLLVRQLLRLPGSRPVPRSSGPRSTIRKRSRSRAPTCRTRATSTSTTGRISPSSRWKPDPYLSAIYEDSRLDRYPSNQAINLRGAVGHDIDLGIIHYASDTPYTRAQTLGARGMSFYGMDSTYASTIAILRRIFSKSGMLRAK